MRDTFATALLGTGLMLGSITATHASDGPCDLADIVNPVTYPPTGPQSAPDWVTQYNASTFLLDGRNPLGRSLGAPRAIITEQDPSVWNKLVTFGETDGITIQMLDPDTQEVVPYHIENPVLVVTLSTNSPTTFATVDGTSGLSPFADGYLPGPIVEGIDEIVFPPYYVNSQDGTLNNWMAAHQAVGKTPRGFVYAPGTPLDYIRRVLGRGPCLNPDGPAGSETACVIANSSGVTGLGMPFMFAAPGTDSFDDPYEIVPGALDCVQPANVQWWKQELFVFVADRDAFVRPSFNPSLRTSTAALPTDNGRPTWDDVAGTYRPPQPDEPLYASYQAATADFVGFATPGFACPQDANPCAPGSCHVAPVPYLGTEGFEEWLSQWKQNSWTIQGSRPNNDELADMTTPAGFPFSGLGLTLNWTEFDPNTPGHLNTKFGAISELIHATSKPMFLVKVLNPNQYYGAPIGAQVPWCETCPGDFNRDGTVDALDLGILLEHWGGEGQCFKLDFSSPSIGAGDLGALFANWGGCPEWPLPQFVPLDCR